jgi:cell division protein FtsW
MAYKPSSDRTLFFIASMLTIFGLVMVYSASSALSTSEHGVSYYYFMRQLGYAVVGYVLMLLLMSVDYHVWQKKKVIGCLAAMCLVALLAVFLQDKINGAHRWLRYGSISFQPSEIAKLAVLFFLAAFLHQRDSEINRPVKTLLPCLSFVGIFVALIGWEPDLGQAACIAAIATGLLFLAGLSWIYIGGAVALCVPTFYFQVVCEPFRWARVQAFLHPFNDPLGSGWQVTQSLTAVGSGGVTGLGLGASKQKLFFLPYAHSDFIFAVIGEELGLIGTALVVLAFLLLFYRGLKIAMRAPDRFGLYLGSGITLMIVLQALINVSMVLSMMPTKGIALPFISQGGSSLLLNLMATGVLLNIAQYGEKDSNEQAAGA